MRNIVLFSFMLIILSSFAFAACPSSESFYAEYTKCGDACMKVPDLIERNNCVNDCLGALSRGLDSRSACIKLEQQEAEERAKSERQRQLDEEAAERARLDAEQHARENAAAWTYSGGGTVELGSSAVNSDAQLLRDGKVTKLSNSDHIGPGDAISTYSVGPVGVGSQVENIQFGANTLAQYIGMSFSPPGINAGPGPWDFAKAYGLRSEDEWAFLTDLMNAMAPAVPYIEPVLPCLVMLGKSAPAAAACTGVVLVFVSAGKMRMQTHTTGSDGVKMILTPSAAVAHSGTDYTVEVDGNGTTTVIVLNGSVSVMDIKSRKLTTVAAQQMISIPKTERGLTGEELKQRVVSTDTEKVDEWWVEKSKTNFWQDRRLLFAVAAAVLVLGIVILVINRRKKK